MSDSDSGSSQKSGLGFLDDEWDWKFDDRETRFIGKRTGKYFDPKKIVTKQDGFMHYIGSDSSEDEHEKKQRQAQQIVNRIRNKKPKEKVRQQFKQQAVDRVQQRGNDHIQKKASDKYQKNIQRRHQKRHEYALQSERKKDEKAQTRRLSEMSLDDLSFSVDESIPVYVKSKDKRGNESNSSSETQMNEGAGMNRNTQERNNEQFERKNFEKTVKNEAFVPSSKTGRKSKYYLESDLSPDQIKIRTHQRKSEALRRETEEKRLMEAKKEQMRLKEQLKRQKKRNPKGDQRRENKKSEFPNKIESKPKNSRDEQKKAKNEQKKVLAQENPTQKRVSRHRDDKKNHQEKVQKKPQNQTLEISNVSSINKNKDSIDLNVSQKEQFEQILQVLDDYYDYDTKDELNVAKLESKASELTQKSGKREGSTKNVPQIAVNRPENEYSRQSAVDEHLKMKKKGHRNKKKSSEESFLTESLTKGAVDYHQIQKMRKRDEQQKQNKIKIEQLEMFNEDHKRQRPKSPTKPSLRTDKHQFVRDQELIDSQSKKEKQNSKNKKRKKNQRERSKNNSGFLDGQQKESLSMEQKNDNDQFQQEFSVQQKAQIRKEARKADKKLKRSERPIRVNEKDLNNPQPKNENSKPQTNRPKQKQQKISAEISKQPNIPREIKNLTNTKQKNNSLRNNSSEKNEKLEEQHERPLRNRIQPTKYWQNERVIYSKNRKAIKKVTNDVSELAGLRDKNKNKEIFVKEDSRLKNRILKQKLYIDKGQIWEFDGFGDEFEELEIEYQKFTPENDNKIEIYIERDSDLLSLSGVERIQPNTGSFFIQNVSHFQIPVILTLHRSRQSYHL